MEKLEKNNCIKKGIYYINIIMWIFEIITNDLTPEQISSCILTNIMMKNESFSLKYVNYNFIYNMSYLDYTYLT